jgi:hypothetical protein
MQSHGKMYEGVFTIRHINRLHLSNNSAYLPPRPGRTSGEIVEWVKDSVVHGNVIAPALKGARRQLKKIIVLCKAVFRMRKLH